MNLTDYNQRILNRLTKDKTMTYGENIMSDKIPLNKQSRLAAIMLSIKDYVAKQDQSLYGAEISLRTRDYAHLQRCTERLIAGAAQIQILTNEARELQDEIENESKADIL